MGCFCSKKEFVEDLQKYSPSSNLKELPLIEPIKTERIIYEEKIKSIYYIEYNKQNGRRYKN